MVFYFVIQEKHCSVEDIYEINIYYVLNKHVAVCLLLVGPLIVIWVNYSGDNIKAVSKDLEIFVFIPSHCILIVFLFCG